MSNDDPTQLQAITDGARKAAEEEKDMTFKRGCVTHCKALVWSVLFTSAIIMEGFDLALIAGFYAFPEFQVEFGELSPKSKNWPHREVPPAWQTALSAGAQIGQITGLLMAGLIAQKIGYKRTMLGALALMIVFILIPFFAENKPVLLIGEVMQGIPWGVFETMPIAYASDVCPQVMKPYVTTYANVCWVFGQLIAALVLRGFLNVRGEWAFRIPFALQWIWPLPILVIVLLAPESPWWLQRYGHTEAARLSLQRTTNYNEEKINNKLEWIKHTILQEANRNDSKEDARTLRSYIKCFRGVDRRRTEITCGIWMAQALCGSNLMAFAAYFFTQAGLRTDQAFNVQIIALVLGVAGTLLAWVLMNHTGRRTIYIWGLWVLFLVLLVIGLLNVFIPQDGTKRSGHEWATAILLAVYIVIYDTSVGPCCYAMVTDICSVALKAPTVALARICYNFCGILSVVLNPQMLNPGGWNWGPKATLLWAGSCFLCWMWAFWRLPELKGRTPGELDILFHGKVKARNFKSTPVDQFSSAHLHVKSLPSEPSSQEKLCDSGSIKRG
ncbi:general substrate transporter [Pseudomassariella vexata]|uniref:General substrate transporter n=1 Tax=Pseudomassariella vexata TaxID=1141098 RepID=A0A1Y2EEF6_9PEZI|nr:general substrate transporter [Pseudomassariella vexata]ORY69952.1 general substrate transporter [Pseudomassariella vexata]